MQAYKKFLIACYLDYVNNYLTMAKFAEHNEISEQQAQRLIDLGRDIHEANLKFIKELEK